MSTCIGPVSQEARPRIAVLPGERSYWEGRLSDAYSLDGVGWRGLGEPFNRWMYRVRRRLFLRRMRPLVKGRAPDVLDVGSGTGFYVERWLELGAGSVTGSDITSTAVERLSARFPGQEFRRLDVSAAMESSSIRRASTPSRRWTCSSTSPTTTPTREPWTTWRGCCAPAACWC